MKAWRRVFSLWFLYVTAAAAQVTAIKAGRLVDVDSGTILTDQVVLIRDSRITAVGKSLAIPAAVAIQNARLYEQADILRAELEQRLADLEQAERALREVHHSREVS